MEKTPLPTWRIYLEWKLLDGYAPLLSEAFVDRRTSPSTAPP